MDHLLTISPPWLQLLTATAKILEVRRNQSGHWMSRAALFFLWRGPQSAEFDPETRKTDT
jgi:hypothetical protein